MNNDDEKRSFTSTLVSSALNDTEKHAFSDIEIKDYPSHDLSEVNMVPKIVEEDTESLRPMTRKEKTERIFLFVGLSIAMFMASLNSTVIAPALGVIANDLQDLPDMTWVATGYILSFNASQPLYGKFSDIFGRKVVMLTAIIIFIIGALGSALSVNMYMLIVFRSFQGVGGGGVISSIMIIISDIYTLEERPKYQSIVTSMFGLASVIGPLMGGAFVDKLTWRWDFWVNLIFGGIALAAIVLFLRIPHTPSPLSAKLKRVDYIGTFLEVAMVVVLLLALNWGGEKFAWNSGPIIGCFVASAVCLIAFCGVEGWVAIEPVIPGRLFRRPVLVLIFICNFCLGLGFLGMLYYAPVLFEVAYGTDSTGAGIRLIPLMLTMVVSSVISAILLKKVGGTQPFIILGCILEVIGFALFYTIDENSNLGMQLGYLLIAGAGLGFTFQNNILAAQAAVDRKDMAIATAMTQFMNSMGGSIGIALYGAIMGNSLKSQFANLDPTILAEAVKYGADQSYLAVSLLPADIKPQIVHIYVNALRTVFMASIPIAGVALVCSLFMRTPKLADMAKIQAEREELDQK